MASSGAPVAVPGAAIGLWLAGVLVTTSGAACALGGTLPRPAGRDWALVGLVLAGAMVFRTVGRADLPWGPEGSMVPYMGSLLEHAWRLGPETGYPVYHFDSGLIVFYLVAGAFDVLGRRPDLYVLAFPPLAAMGVALVCVWGASTLRRPAARVAFAAAVGFAAYDAVAWSWPNEYATHNAVLCATLAALYLATRRGWHAGFAWAGLAFGAMAYASLTFLALFPLPLLYVAWARRTNGDAVPWRRGAGVFALVAAVTLAPFAWTLAADSEVVLGRALLRSNVHNPDLFEEDAPPTSVRILARAGKAAAYFVTGDFDLVDRGETGVVGRQTPLRPWLVPCVLLGLGWVLVPAFRTRRIDAMDLTVVVWALVPIALAAANRVIAERYYIALPAYYYLALVPVDGARGRAAKGVAAIVVLATVVGTAWDARAYFRGFGIDMPEPFVAEALVVNRLLAEDPDVPIVPTFHCRQGCAWNPAAAGRPLVELTTPRALAVWKAWYREPDGTCSGRESDARDYRRFALSLSPEAERLRLVLPHPDPCRERVLATLGEVAEVGEGRVVGVESRAYDRVRARYEVIEIRPRGR